MNRETQLISSTILDENRTFSYEFYFNESLKRA